MVVQPNPLPIPAQIVYQASEALLASQARDRDIFSIAGKVALIEHHQVFPDPRDPLHPRCPFRDLFWSGWVLLGWWCTDPLGVIQTHHLVEDAPIGLAPPLRTSRALSEKSQGLVDLSMHVQAVLGCGSMEGEKDLRDPCFRAGEPYLVKVQSESSPGDTKSRGPNGQRPRNRHRHPAIVQAKCGDAWWRICHPIRGIVPGIHQATVIWTRRLLRCCCHLDAYVTICIPGLILINDVKSTPLVCIEIAVGKVCQLRHVDHWHCDRVAQPVALPLQDNPAVTSRHGGCEGSTVWRPASQLDPVPVDHWP